MKTFIAFFLLGILFVHPAFAEDGEEGKTINPLLAVALVEGLFAVNAGMATLSPEIYGVVLTLLSPLGASPMVSDATNWVAIGGAVSIGLYNAIELGREKYSKGDIFVKNMYAWHGFVALIFLAESVTGQKTEPKNIAVVPMNGGMGLVFAGRF